VACLPDDSKSASKDQWGRPGIARPEGASLVDLVAITEGTDAALAKRAASHVLAWRKHFGLDRVVVPAVKRLLQAKKRGGPAFDVLRSASVGHLQQRIAEPLEAPRDWAGPTQLGCKWQHCSELSRFLADLPQRLREQPSVVFAGAAPGRQTTLASRTTDECGAAPIYLDLARS
jgi:hypothetical protein